MKLSKGNENEVGNFTNKKKKPFYKRWWFIIIVLFLIVGAFGSTDDTESDVVSNEAVIEENEVVEEEQTVIDQDEEYIMHVVVNSQMIGEHMTEISRLSTAADFSNQSWLQEMKSEINSVKNYANAAHSFTPTDRFKDIHIMYIEAVDNYRMGVEHLEVGIDEQDSASIELGSRFVETGNSLIINVAEEIEKLNN